MRKEERDRLVEQYASLPYTVKLYPEEEGGYTAEVEELEGCLTQGETVQEALSNLEEARRLWIETALSMGKEIPLPRSRQSYSGRILLRLPSYLHRRLSLMAKREGVSLNQLIVSLLSEASALEEIKQSLAYIERQMYRQAHPSGGYSLENSDLILLEGEIA